MSAVDELVESIDESALAVGTPVESGAAVFDMLRDLENGARAGGSRPSELESWTLRNAMVVLSDSCVDYEDGDAGPVSGASEELLKAMYACARRLMLRETRRSAPGGPTEYNERMAAALILAAKALSWSDSGCSEHGDPMNVRDMREFFSPGFLVTKLRALGADPNMELFANTRSPSIDSMYAAERRMAADADYQPCVLENRFDFRTGRLMEDIPIVRHQDLEHIFTPAEMQRNSQRESVAPIPTPRVAGYVERTLVHAARGAWPALLRRCGALQGVTSREAYYGYEPGHPESSRRGMRALNLAPGDLPDDAKRALRTYWGVPAWAALAIDVAADAYGPALRGLLDVGDIVTPRLLDSLGVAVFMATVYQLNRLASGVMSQRCVRVSSNATAATNVASSVGGGLRHANIQEVEAMHRYALENVPEIERGCRRAARVLKQLEDHDDELYCHERL